MEEFVKNNSTFTITGVETPSEITIAEENSKMRDEIMQKILSENVSVAVGNYLFIPPLANPLVSSPDKAIEIMKQDNFSDGYVTNNIEIDGKPVNVVIHISRLVHEGTPISVKVYSVDKFSESDIRIVFKNDFPRLFVQTLATLMYQRNNIT